MATNKDAFEVVVLHDIPVPERDGPTTVVGQVVAEDAMAFGVVVRSMHLHGLSADADSDPRMVAQAARMCALVLVQFADELELREGIERQH